MKVINVSFFIKEEKRSEFLKLTDQLLASSRKEEGCLSYELFESLEETNKFMMVENWQDAAAVAAHNRSQELVQLFQSLPQLITEETKVTVSTID